MSATETLIAYKFLKILSTPWREQEAFALGIIDAKGNILRPMSSLKTNAEKQAYTIVHRLVWNIKRLLDRVPASQTRIGSFAAGLWLLKEATGSNPGGAIESTFVSYLRQHGRAKRDILNETFDSMFGSHNTIAPGVYVVDNKSLDHHGQSVVVEKAIHPFGDFLFTPLYKIEIGAGSSVHKVVVSHGDLRSI